MNYRHIYHAGNPCDVAKHAVLALILHRLAQKEAGFVAFDTHAGAGLYDLQDPRAQKSGESDAGFGRLLAAPPLPSLAGYGTLLRELNPDGQPRFYPGSPALVRRLLRPQDLLILCEKHPEEAHELKRHFRNDPRIRVHHRDGYEALTALLPPERARGLVFVDPPFEKPDEWERLVEAARTVHARWPQGCLALWYPIKERPAVWRFHDALGAAGIPKLLVTEYVYQEEARHDRLNGGGLILVNPPWQIEQDIAEAYQALHAVCKTSHRGDHVGWLAS